VFFYQCSNCGLIQSEKPYWLEEAYKDSISILDTGILSRNIDLLNKVLVVLSSIENKFKNTIYRVLELSAFSKKLLDYGGGYGILVRLLRDVGIDAFWLDKYSKNLYAKGFEWAGETKPYVLTSFELWEHFENPKEELDFVFKEYSPDIYIFSTLLYGDKVPNINWWYYSFETGQHIAFYNEKTINYISNLYGYKYFKLDDGFHILAKNFLLNSRISKNYFRYCWLSFLTKRIYQSKTFEDHLNLKKLINKKQ
jgi:hypothetical protein